MATVERGPLVLPAQDHRATHALGVIAPPNLLATVLAPVGAIPLPLPAYLRNFPPQVLARPDAMYLNPDTSRGTPKTLINELVLPRGTVAPFFSPVFRSPWKWLNPDTSAGTPKTLRPELVLPRGTVAPFLPQLMRQGENWLPADTSQSKPQVTFAETNPHNVAPFFQQAQHPKNEWLNPDTSRGTPKTLRPESGPPDGTVEPFFMQVQHPAHEYLNPDTTQSTPKGLIPEVALPSGTVAPHFPPLRFWFMPEDSTRGTPKTLLPAEALPPGASVTSSGVLRYPHNLTDTSQSSYALASPPPPVITSVNIHSWFVKGIGIKTKISTSSQVDSDTGDVP